MDRLVKKVKDRQRRHMRARRKITGTAERPRLAVFRSTRNIYAQLIDDLKGVTIASASTKSSDFDGANGSNIEAAKKIGAVIAAKAKEAKVETVVFDCGGRKYHGRVKALAEGAREGGLKF
ncbi:MAG: 50S ribosomal protein L18 [Planctomycetes bacterium]|nr:50S ribosomal protein L18 [Planctomycetota bacterium]